MLATFLFALVVGVPTGVYSFSELADQLTRTTGEKYKLDGGGYDPSIFVSVKDGDPQRVKKLVAAVYGGKWVKKDDVWLLYTGVYDDYSADLKRFEEVFLASCPEKSAIKSIPINDIFISNVGECRAFGDSPNQRILRLPKNDSSTSNQPRSLIFRRNAIGYFEYLEDGAHVDLKITVLPKKVEEFLKKTLDEVALDSEQMKKVEEWKRDYRDHKMSFLDPEKKSPFVQLAEIMLPPLAKAMKRDVVIPVYDTTSFALPELTEATSVRSILKALSACMFWDINDDGLIGIRRSVENAVDTQANRARLRAFLGDRNERGISRRGGIEALMADLNGGGKAGTDKVVLEAEGMDMSDREMLDFPYNFELAVRIADEERTRLEEGKRVLLSELPSHVSTAAMNVLLHSRRRVSNGFSDNDPFFWPSLELKDIFLSYSCQSDIFLVFRSFNKVELLTPYEAGLTHNQRAKTIQRNPVYAKTTRYKMRFTIGSTLSGNRIRSSFTKEWLFGPEQVISEWQHLPQDVRDEFERGLRESQ